MNKADLIDWVREFKQILKIVLPALITWHLPSPKYRRKKKAEKPSGTN